MSVGPLSRVELTRTSLTEARTTSATSIKGTIIQPTISVQSGCQQPTLSGGVLGAGSDTSSRDVSPVRQASGPTSIDWQPVATGISSEAANLPKNVSEASPLNVDPATLLDTVPSFGYERGCRALWLDRHASLKSPLCKEASPKPSPKKETKVQGPSESAGDCLRYCPSWAISQSMLWALVEQYIDHNPSLPQSPAPSLSSSLPSAPDAPPATPPSSSHSATHPADPGSDPAPSPAIPTPALTQTASQPLHTLPSNPLSQPFLSPAASCPLPVGLGIGLSTPPRFRFKRAALSVIARGRMHLRRGLREAHEAELAAELAAEAEADEGCVEVWAGRGQFLAQYCPGEGEEDGPADTSGADERVHITAVPPHDAVLDKEEYGSRQPRPQQQSPQSAAAAKRFGGGGAGGATVGNNGVVRTVANSIAKALTTCPAARRVVRRRVQTVVAGISVLYTAANLLGCAAALTHADFSDDFASSAKAVLDFVVTAPSIAGIAGDLLQIGVAVGLGMAQRRPPTL